MAQLLDQYGRPIKKSLLRREISSPSFASVRSIVSSHQTRGITPQRLAVILREAEDGDAEAYLDLAEDMEERDLHYLAVLSTRRRQVSQLTVTVEPADESAEAEADAELVRAWIDRQELEDELFDLLDAVGKGFAVCEIIWEMSESQWMPMRLEYRLPRWFEYDRETGTELRLRDIGGEVGLAELEPAKFVVHRHAAKSGLPIRGGLARCAAWAWMFKNYTTRDWVRFVEAYGQPLRLGKYDKASTDDERGVLLRAVSNIAADAAAIVPMGMEIEFPEPSDASSRSEIYLDLLNYLDAQISKAVLGQTLTTDTSESGGGAYALGKVHDEVRHDIERSDARQLAATLNRDIVRPLILLNRGERKAFPRIVIGREEQSDPAMLSEAVSKLVPLGLPVGAEEMLGKLGLSMPEEGAQVLEAPAPPPMPKPGDEDPDEEDEDLDEDEDEPPETARAGGRRARRSRDAIGRAVDDLVQGDGWEPMMEPVIEPILEEARAALERGESLEAFRDRLPVLFAEMDDSNLVETLRRMGFSARLSGNAGLEEDRDER